MWNVFKWLNSALNNAEWRLSLWNMLFGSGGLMVSGGLLAGWAVYATETLQQYAPASYVAAAIVAYFLIGAAFALRAWAKGQLQAIRFRQHVYDNDRINPLDDTFRRQRIRIVDLCDPVTAYVRDKTFVDCDILGPANVVILPGCSFSGNGGENVDGLIFTEAAPKTGFHIENCTFKSCRFYFITFMVPSVLYELFERHGWSGLNWITVRPEKAVVTLPAPTEERDR